MAEIMAGEASPSQLAAFAVLLRAKGETPAEHTGLVEAMLAVGERVQVAGPLLDVVGTGGDRANTVNLSTMSALVAAGAGARVAKHGNRAASSSAGAADVLEALGVAIGLPGPAVARCVEEAGIGFCFAGVFRPADGADHGRGAGRAGRDRAGLPRRRRAGRADHHDDLAGLGGPRRRG